MITIAAEKTGYFEMPDLSVGVSNIGNSADFVFLTDYADYTDFLDFTFLIL